MLVAWLNSVAASPSLGHCCAGPCWCSPHNRCFAWFSLSTPFRKLKRQPNPIHSPRFAYLTSVWDAQCKKVYKKWKPKRHRDLLQLDALHRIHHPSMPWNPTHWHLIRKLYMRQWNMLILVTSHSRWWNAEFDLPLNQMFQFKQRKKSNSVCPMQELSARMQNTSRRKCR
jgi:hypothetical protein